MVMYSLDVSTHWDQKFGSGSELWLYLPSGMF
jgi:hypothetical protein